MSDILVVLWVPNQPVIIIFQIQLCCDVKSIIFINVFDSAELDTFQRNVFDEIQVLKDVIVGKYEMLQFIVASCLQLF